MTARPLPPPARPVTPAGQVAAYLDRAGQGDGTYDEKTGRLIRYRPYGRSSDPAARGYVFRPYVYGAPRAAWATQDLDGYPHPGIQVARARRAAGQHQERRQAA